MDAVVVKSRVKRNNWSDGKESDVAAVKAAVEAYAATTKTGYATQDRNRRAYDRKLSGRLLFFLLQEKVTQVEIDTALANWQLLRKIRWCQRTSYWIYKN